MQVHCLLVYGVSLPCHICCDKVENHTYYSKDNHSAVVYRYGIQKSSDRPDDDQDRAHQQYCCGDNPAQHGVAYIAVSIFFISFLFAFLLKKIGYTDGQRVAQIVEGIGKDSHRIDK